MSVAGTRPRPLPVGIAPVYNLTLLWTENMMSVTASFMQEIVICVLSRNWNKETVENQVWAVTMHVRNVKETPTSLILPQRVCILSFQHRNLSSFPPYPEPPSQVFGSVGNEPPSSPSPLAFGSYCAWLHRSGRCWLPVIDRAHPARCPQSVTHLSMLSYQTYCWNKTHTQNISLVPAKGQDWEDGSDSKAPTTQVWEPELSSSGHKAGRGAVCL